jgi:hypothetical protein
MARAGTWREHPFRPGKIYVATESFRGFPLSEFVSGQAYEFQDVGYSHYDGCTIFVFREIGGSEPTYWWWHDDEPESLCRSRFRILDDAPKGS